MQSADILKQYFPNLTPHQLNQFNEFGALLLDWNAKINLISRKDHEHFMERHVLHSLAIAHYLQFNPNAKVLDIGTGGGFPGIPLAIMFPDTHFTLVDSIGKKISVVQDIAHKLELDNVQAFHKRVEELKNMRFDFIVSRAVAQTKELVKWTNQMFLPKSQHNVPNGYLLLKGGDLAEELSVVNKPYNVMNISDFVSMPFFETKKLVWISK